MARNAAEKAALAAQAANESEAQFKVRAESAYVAAGGTALGFISEWPGLRAELVRQRTLAVLGAPPTNLVRVPARLARKCTLRNRVIPYPVYN